MTKLQVGDRVRVISESYGKDQLGKTGRVVEIDRGGPLDIEIEYDEALNGNGLKRNQYRSKHLELISPTGPVRTVTRREVVPGVWSRVRVSASSLDGEVCVKIEPAAKGTTPSLNADELRAAAAVLLELAGALE